MNKLYLFPDGSKLYAPDRRLDDRTAHEIRLGLSKMMTAPPGLIVMGEPVEVVDLRDPVPATVAVVDVPARMAALGFPDYDYLP